MVSRWLTIEKMHDIYKKDRICVELVSKEDRKSMDFYILVTDYARWGRSKIWSAKTFRRVSSCDQAAMKF